ncbi:hypothetical protein ZWY2020_014057 [Hordeum vulgare]|nr:hypothetical protein ZWY2020_014057 [Hordeum vulgare]
MGRNEEKARVALDAMKKLGFGRKQAIPVLKRLFRLFQQQWEPIEAESYRALADAILDDQLQANADADADANGNGGAVSVDGDEAPGQGQGQGQEQPEMSTSRPQTSGSRTDFRPSAPPPTTAIGDENRANQHHSRNTDMSVEPTSTTLINGTRSQVQEAPPLEIDVASSPGGEVKLSLKCSAHPSKLNMPDLEAVYKMVEDKYVCSGKLLPPDFTIRRLMAEICQGVVQLGTQHTDTVEHITQSDTVDSEHV